MSFITAISRPAPPTAAEPPPSELVSWLRHPLLVSTLYRHAVSADYDPTGAAGANRIAYRWIEEQRQGAEWIVRGYAERKSEWLDLGWRQLNWGLAHQQPDGGFASCSNPTARIRKRTASMPAIRWWACSWPCATGRCAAIQR